MKSKILVTVSLAWLAIAAACPARADYFINQGSQTPIKAGVVGSAILPWMSPVDAGGNAFGTLTNPFSLQFGSGVTLPSFSTPQHFICDSGCGGGGGGGLSVPFGGAIGANGTPIGFKDGSGNFQALLGDVTNGQWVSVKGTLPAFAATPTFNIGTAPTITVTGTVTANAGTNLNTSLLALEGGGNLASINTKTPALGQALAAASVPVVLTALQVTALTPLSTVTVQQPTGTNLHIVCDSGCSGSGGTSSNFAATFPTAGTAIGMSQGGNMVAMTGTSGNLNVQCANCSGSGASALDAATFTAGTSVFAPMGGEFTSGGATACVTGHQCISAITADRATFTNLADIAGATVLTGTGAVGSGAQRVAIGIDTATIAGSAPGTAGTASGNVLTIQGIASMTPVQVSQATAASLNATVVGTGTFAVQLSGATNNINNIAGTISLPTGASTAALQPTNAAQGSATSGQTGPLMQAAVLTAAPTYTTAQTSPLNMTVGGALRVADTSVVTALGSPFQAGASIGNTSFAATQATASALNATVVGTGTFAVQATLQASATTAIGKVDPNTIGLWGLAASTQNGTTPTNGHLMMGQFNTTPTTITSGNVSPFQLDSAGNLLVTIKAPTTLPVSVASGAAVRGALVDINDGTNTAYSGSGTSSLLGGIYGLYSQLATLNTTATAPAPCKAAATWNASTGLTGTQPAGCDGSAALWGDIGAVGGTAVGTFGTPPGAVPAVPVNSYPNLGTLALGSTFVTGTTAAMTGTSPTQIVALVASKRLYINRVKCNNSSGTATLVQITDGSAGTVLDTLAAGATYGGEAGVGTTPLFWTTAGNGLYAQDVTTGASVICTASGYSG